MKKGFIIGGIVLTIGLVFAFIAFNIGGKNIFELSSTTQEKSYTFEGNYNSISIETENDSIIIGESPDDMVHLTTYENSKNSYQIIDNQNLTIQPKEKLIDEFEIDFNLSSIGTQSSAELLIPKDMQTKLSVNTENGYIQVYNMNLENMDLESDNGFIEVSNVTTTGNIRTNTDSGNIKIDQATSDNINIESDNGTIDLYTVDCNSINIESDNGGVNITDANFQNSLIIDNDNGQVYCDLLGSEYDYNYKFKTDFGSIFLNDMHIDLGLSPNNNNTTTYGTGVKTIAIESENGDIKITTQQ